MDNQLREGFEPSPTKNISTEIIREIIIPEIEREVNEGKNFVKLRLVYNSLILGKWYKETIKDSLLSKVYVDQNKILGINLEDETVKDQIYQRYIEAYKKGVFNYIKEDYDRLTDELIPRKYFSGGVTRLMEVELEETNDPGEIVSSATGNNFELAIKADPLREDGSLRVAGSPVTEEEAADYQQEAKERFAGFTETARNGFNPELTDAQIISEKIKKNNGNKESMFHHVRVYANEEIRQRYDQVQKIVREILGEDIKVINMELDEIHVTITNDDVAPREELTLTLEQLEREVRKDVEGVSPFNIQLVGPHLNNNGVMIMEYTTSASEFLYLRKKRRRGD